MEDLLQLFMLRLMHFLQATGKVFMLSLLMLLLSQCEVEEIEPIDIFEQTEVIPTNVEALPLQNFGNARLSVAPENIRKTDYGYQVKGAMYAESSAGSYMVSSGDFKITTDAAGNTTSMEGYGTVQFPEAGFMQGQVSFADVYGAFITYNTGKWFKDNQDDGDELPLDDDTYYFHFAMPNLFEEGEDGLAMIGNMLYNFGSIYLDPTDPAIFFQGDASLYEEGDKPEKVPGKGGKKKFKGNKSAAVWSILSGQFGFSVGSNLHFEPFEYSATITELMGDQGFEPISGFMFMAGEIPLKKYPILIDGRMLTAADAVDVQQDFFEEGPMNNMLKLGVNGKVKFGHALLDFIPLDLEVELGRATLMSGNFGGKNQLKIAGEYGNEVFFKKMLPEAIFKYFPFNSDEVQLYLNLGEEPEDWQLSFQTKSKFNIPGAGQQEMRDMVISFNEQGAFLSSEINLPFGLGTTKMVGKINADGTFALHGKRATMLNFGNNVRISTFMDITITEQGISLNGEVELPAVGMVAVSGEINGNELILKGNRLMDIDFGNNLVLSSQMDIELNTNTGVFLNGSLNLPGGIGNFAVTGEVSTYGITLTGEQGANIVFAPGAELRSLYSLKASTYDNPGVFLSGEVNLPGNISGVELSGEISARGVSMTGEHNVKLDFGHGVRTYSLMAIAAKSYGPDAGVHLYGKMQLPLGIADLDVMASLNNRGLYFMGEGNVDLPFVFGPTLNADLKVHAATYGNPGATFRGGFNLPGNLIRATITEGRFNDSGFNFTARASGLLDFKVTKLRGTMNITANSSARNYLALSGNVDLPFGLGNKSINGSFVLDNFYFNATSSVEASEGPFSVHAQIIATASKNNLTFKAEGEACFVDVCIGSGISVTPTWSGADRGLKVCAFIPLVGEKCLTIK